MKLTTAAVLAFAAASILGGPVSSKDTAVYARDLHERDSGEVFLQSFEKRKGGGGALKPGMLKSLFGAFGTMGGRVASSSAQLGILKSMIPPAPPPPAAMQAPPTIPPPALHLKRRDLSGPITHLEILEKRRRRGGADKTPSLLKSIFGAAGTMGGRLASSSAQLGILKKMIPPAPPPPPPSSGQSPPKPASPSPPQPIPKPPTPTPAPVPVPVPAPAPLQPSSPFIPPAVPPFPHFPQILPPPVPHMRRRSLSRPIGRLQTFEKRRRRRGGADKSPSMFKSVSGAVGTMGGRVASSSAQLGILKTMIPPAPPPPPPPVQRRDLSRPVARAFAPMLAIKNGFSRFAKASSRAHNRTAPARKGTKKVLIALFDGIAKGIAV